MTRSYEIIPRSTDLGGGWNLKLFENGEEMGGGVFPPVPSTVPDFDEAYQDALEEGEQWGTPIEPAFLDDDGPSEDMPTFVTRRNAIDLFGLREGETIQEAMARHKAERRWAHEQSLASSRIEGHVPSAAYLADSEAVIEGTMTLEEAGARSLARALASKADPQT